MLKRMAAVVLGHVRAGDYSSIFFFTVVRKLRLLKSYVRVMDVRPRTTDELPVIFRASEQVLALSIFRIIRYFNVYIG